MLLRHPVHLRRAILALELLASRILTPYFGVSLYIWTGILSITLVALALGYWAGGRLAAGPRIANNAARLAQLLRADAGAWPPSPSSRPASSIPTCFRCSPAPTSSGRVRGLPRPAVRAAGRSLGNEPAAGCDPACARRRTGRRRRRGQGVFHQHPRLGRGRAGHRVRADSLRQQLFRDARGGARAGAALARGRGAPAGAARLPQAARTRRRRRRAARGPVPVARRRLHRPHVAGQLRRPDLAGGGALQFPLRHRESPAQRSRRQRPLRPHLLPGRAGAEHGRLRRALAVVLYLRPGGPGLRLPARHALGAGAGPRRRHRADAARRTGRGGGSGRDRPGLAGGGDPLSSASTRRACACTSPTRARS